MASNIIKCDDVKINKVNYTKPEKNGQSIFHQSVMAMD